MSADTHTHAHDAHHDAHGADAPHGSMRDYIIGFVLSVILTAIPFALVMTGVLDHTWTAVLVLGAAVIQVFVHMIYFLHMNTSNEGGWSFLALLFTLIVIVITLSGSIWVMYHMNANMMPMTQDMQTETMSQQ
ncbi:cytochrome o ubiquinol oxidase subunit IV [Sphingomonas sp. RB3P16]|uniref:cytochrome o ubiquinol oxidase subunit IV n=1 Tax=Parasphingomonas frigoris TaxID=3096163 RepID=UPI002FC82F7B